MTEQQGELPRAEWHNFFEMLTKDYEGSNVTVEVLNRSFGDQLEAASLPLAYLEYDEKDDCFSVGLGGRDSRFPVVLRHAISRPRRILTTSSIPGMPWALDIEDQEGTQTLVTLHMRPAIP
ncbi:DUF5335 family protein [Microtetraspora sp. NBRC 16547]|uniref:DUF5335 family protein n=1 Tax=Microtetraspora sp. NBRC 16547 TaxID=3030993 RepID=UPI0024A5E86D|nr:DUF5335 family protein [Microtetraspora sp. NBRC 16547]GLX01675.1 hypothetical protein Misp02_57610 [Microtetraspora sp. NBRC 16547]